MAYLATLGTPDKHGFNNVTILHPELVRRIVHIDALAVEEESDILQGHASPLARREHELLKLRVGLALEGFLNVVRPEDVELHGLGFGLLSLLRDLVEIFRSKRHMNIWRSAPFRHRLHLYRFLVRTDPAVCGLLA